MNRKRRLSLIAVLLLSTLLWGTGLAAHQHLDNSAHCDVCLLPHAAAVAHQDIPLPAKQPVENWVVNSLSSPDLPLALPYQSRAPPAV